MKELKEFTVERLEEIEVDAYEANPTKEEMRALAKIALAAKQAKPDYYIHAVEVCDSYGPDIELRVFNIALEASKCNDDHGGEIIPAYTTPPLNHNVHHLYMVKLLRNLVDVVWSDAKESDEVPSTKWADELIAKVYQVAAPKPEM